MTVCPLYTDAMAEAGYVTSYRVYPFFSLTYMMSLTLQMLEAL